MISQIFRFLVVGGSNTLFTYGIFISLGLLLPAWIAYTIAFSVGIVWTLFGTSKFVFKANPTLLSGFLFVSWYILLYVVGQFIIYIFKPINFESLAITSLFILLFTTPLTFLGGRFLFGKPAEK